MSQCTIERTIWQLPRTGVWFQLVLKEFSDQEWYENFQHFLTCLVYICIRKEAAAVVRKLKPKYLSIAKGDELALVIANYKEKWGFPCVLEQSMAHIYQFQHHSKIMQVTTTGNGTTVL